MSERPMKKTWTKNDQQSTNWVLSKLHEMSFDFGRDSDGTFIECIGALDGLAVGIKYCT